VLIRDRNAEILYSILNEYEVGSTIEEARLEFQKRAKQPVSYGYITQVICDVRKGRNRYGWTVSPCKKGAGGSGLIFAIPQQRDGSFEVSDDHRKEFDAGAAGSMATVASMVENLTMQLTAMAANETSRNKKADLLEHADNFAFAARKLKRNMEQWQRRVA
jgi:hypothetical protein